MTNVKNEMNPCHKPIQKPATSVANFSFPGAHEPSIRITANNKITFKFFLIMISVLSVSKAT